ncbi:MAG: hypothetical protein OHK0012_27590 [Synechococcales cyanobacterium]
MRLYALLRDWVGQDQPHFFWSHGEQLIIGAGSLVHWQDQGIHRFQSFRHVLGDHPGYWMGGFGFFPGDPSGFFSPRCLVRRHGRDTLLTVFETPDTDSDHLWDLIHHLPILPLAPSAGIPTLPTLTPPTLPIPTALRLIEQGSLEKIVLAASLTLTLPTLPSLAQILANLRHLYRDCTVFACAHPLGGVFLGASPEPLVRVQSSHLTTVALAGSAPRHPDPQRDHDLGAALLGSTKDRYEQHLVTESILTTFCQLGITPHLPEHYPSLRQLTHIQHLQTPIQAQLPPHLHLLDVVAALHPTAAVAGLPRERACQSIQRLESFHRGLYAAPIGWLDPLGNGDFVVGIRSAWMTPPQVTLYAGAGIVAGSLVEREQAEITWKWQTLLPAILPASPTAS